MEDLLPGLIVLGVTLVGVAVIFWLVARNRHQREQRMQALASRQGWFYEKVSERKSSGYRFRKSEWTLSAVNESTTEGSDTTTSSVASHTVWQSSSVRMPQGIVLIGPRQPAINLGGLNAVLMQTMLQLMIGKDAEDAKDIHEITLGSLALNDRFMVYTNQDEIVKKLIDERVDAALVAFPGKLPLVARFSPSGLEVKVMGHRLDKEADLLALVKLGNALLESAR